MAHFEIIKDAWLNPGAMITSGLLARLRDNPKALYEDTQAFAFKPDAEAGPGGAGLHDDEDLFFAIGAEEIWHVQGMISYSTGLFDGWQMEIAGPAGATGAIHWAMEDSSIMTPEQGGLGETETISGSATNSVVAWSAYIATGSTAGTIQFRRNPDVGTTVNAGGFIRGHRFDTVDGGVACFTGIPDADLDAKSPTKTSVMYALRDDGIAGYECTRAAVLKTADETVNNDTTLRDDAELTFPVEENERWYVMFCLRSFATNGGLKFDLNVPAGATGTLLGSRHLGLPARLFDVVHVVGTPTELGASVWLWVEGIVTTVGAAGDVTLEWAQDTSDPSDSKVLADSFLIAHRMDKIEPTGAEFGAITDADIDPESRVAEDTEATLQGIRDNIVAIYNNTREEVVKPGDETVTSATTGTTLQDDDDLTFAVAADTQWEFELWLDIATTMIADFKMQITTPDAADVGHYLLWHEPTEDGEMEGHEQDINVPLTLTYGGNVTSSVTIIRGFILIDAVAGDVTLQWAQNTGNANPTTVKAGSTLYVRRIDDLT